MRAQSQLDVPRVSNLKEQFKERDLYQVAHPACLSVAHRDCAGRILKCQKQKRVSGSAAARLAALTPPGHRVVIHVTLTDEYPLAQAQVIIEAVATTDAVEAAIAGNRG